MRTAIRSTAFTVFFTLLPLLLHAQGTWVQQPTALPSNPTTFVQVGGLWGVAMADTGTGFAAGYASVSNGFSGVLRKQAGNPTWFVLPASTFTGLAPSHSLWSGVSAFGTRAWVCGSNGRLYRTTDNGATWNSATTGITATSTLFDIFFKSLNEGMVVGNNGAIYYTSDGGANWTAQTLPATVTATTALYAVHSAGNNWFVSGENNTVIRGNPQVSATSWVDVTGNVPALGLIEALHFLDDQTGSIAGATTPGSGVYRTTNGGGSFSATGSGLASGQTYNAVHFINPQYGWTGYGPSALYFTTNSGQSWSPSPSILLSGQSPSNWVTRIDFPSSGVGYASGGAPGTTSTGWILRYQSPLLPDISTTDTTMSFGTLDCDTSVTKQFTIDNSGMAPLTITQISFSAPGFTLVGPLPTPIPAPGGATISVRWTPLVPGPIPAGTYMRITSNDPSHPIWNVALDGLYNSGTFAIGNAYQFPDACLGNSSEVIVTTTVAGNLQPELINFVFVSGDDMFTLAAPALGDTVKTGDKFYFRFTPTSGGAKSGVYRMTYGNPSCPRSTLITLSGTAFDASLTLSETVVDFGDVCIENSKDMEITVTNSGTVNAVISLREFVSGKNRFPNQHSGPFGPIPAGQSRQYTVRFSPGLNDTGLIEATYNLIVDPCKDTVQITLRGRGVRPAITFIPTSVLAIGPTPTGVTIEEPVQIINSGNSPMTVSAITLNPAHPRLTLINVPPLPFVLGQGQSTSVSVRFVPDRTESINVSLCVHWSDPCADSSCLPVGATSGDAPTIAVDTVHDVGVQRCQPEILDTLWIYNTGKGTLSLQNFSLSGSNTSHFTVRAPSTPHSVVTGDSVAVVIAYRSTTNGTSTAKLTIAHNDPKTGFTTIVALTGERRVVEWTIDGDTLNPYISCARIGSSRSLSIRNGGGGTIEVRDIAVIAGSDVFHAASTPLPVTIPGGSGMTFEINFTPTGKGVFTGKVLITVGPCGDTYLLDLEGLGNVTELSFTPSPVDFGPVTIGGSRTRTIQVHNEGTATMTVTGAWVNPALPELRVVSPPAMPLDIAPGKMQEFSVEFSPASVQTVTAGFCVAVNAPCPDTLCVNLSGRGASTGIGVTRTRMEYQLDPCTSDEQCDSIGVVNNAGQDVTITTARIEPPGGFRLTLPSATPLTLSSGATAMLQICALGDFTGTRSANLVIESNDASSPLLRVPITARRDSSGFTLAETSIDFGTIAPCEAGVSRLVTVTNTGSLVAFIDTVPGTEGFLVTTSLPVALQAGKLTQVRITFAPPRPGIYEDTLFFTTSRCGERVPMLVRGVLHDTNYTVTPDPLVFSSIAVGSSSVQSFTFRNLHLPSVRITDVSVTPSGTDFASWGAYPKTVGLNGSTDLPIQFSPGAAGTQTATACIIIDLPCRDTICVQLSGSTADALLTADPLQLDYDSVAHCSDIAQEVRIRNNGSSPVTLTGSRLEGADAGLFLIDDPVTTPETLQPQGERSFSVRIPADNAPVDGAKQARLVVESDQSSQPEVQVPLSFVRTTLVLPPTQVLDLGPVFIGKTIQRQIVITNAGTHTVVFGSVQVPLGVSTTPTTATLYPGDSIALNISFNHDSRGIYHDSLLYLHDGPCSGHMTIIIKADVIESLAAPDLDFGEVPHCTFTDRNVFIRNLQTEEATITGLGITGGDASFFAIIAPTDFPINVPVGDSLGVTIRITPETGGSRLYAAQLRIDQQEGTQTKEYMIGVTGHGRIATLASSVSAIDFGDVSIQTISPQRTATFINRLPFALRVAAVTPPPAPFTIEGTVPALPADIGPGETLEVTLRFAPETEGVAVELLTLQYESPCQITSSHPMGGNGIDDWVSSTLRIDAHDGMVDDIIDIPIELLTDLASLGIDGWEGAVRFDRSMLYPVEILTAGTLSAGLQPNMQYDGSTGVLALAASGGSVGAGTGTLAIVRFRVLVGSALRTDIVIEPGFRFTGGLARVDQSTDGSFTLLDFCDADGTRLVQPDVEMQMQGNTPNPFSTSTTLEYSVSADGPLHLSIVDRAGRVIATPLDGEIRAGRHRVTIDGARLAPGVYFAVLRGHGQSVVRKLLRLK